MLHHFTLKSTDCCTACGIGVPWPGLQPVPSAVGVQNPNLGFQDTAEHTFFVAKLWLPWPPLLGFPPFSLPRSTFPWPPCLSCSLGSGVPFTDLLSISLIFPPLGQTHPLPHCCSYRTKLTSSSIDAHPPPQPTPTLISNPSCSIPFCFAGCTSRRVGSYFPDQGSNPRTLYWRQSLNHWTTRELPPLQHHPFWT